MPVSRGPSSRGFVVLAQSCGLAVLGCGPPGTGLPDADHASTSTSLASTINTSAASSDASADSTGIGGLDVLNQTPDRERCDRELDEGVFIDVLIVVDNSITMAQEQANVAANFAAIVDRIQWLTDDAGVPIYPSVNLMVTTTDVGHPLCSPDRRRGGAPRAGAPVHLGCNARIASFTGPDENPIDVTDACTTVCPVDVVPSDPFIHFDVFESNVPGDDIAAALSCIGPQGIDGCEYESPLEAMLLALDPTACWNDLMAPGCADDPEWADLDTEFLRHCADLIVFIITDEADCSVAAPEGLAAFTSDDQYWETHPNTGLPAVSSAVCQNAGIACGSPDGNGVYGECESNDTGVLHPTARYVDALRAYGEQHDKQVVMLAALGAPPVTARDVTLPYAPVAGGVFALEHRVWQPSDLTPEEIEAGITVEHKIWELGHVAPGCASQHGSAIFPTRVREVCEGLNDGDDPATEEDETDVQCCIESICDDDFSSAIRCATTLFESSGIIK